MDKRCGVKNRGYFLNQSIIIISQHIMSREDIIRINSKNIEKVIISKLTNNIIICC